MAKRHEDRKPGQRFARGSGKAVKKVAKKAAGKKVAKKLGGKKTGGKKTGMRPAARTSSARALGSKRRAAGIVVTPTTPTDSSALADGLVRLNHFLAKAGVCSRRNADEMITSGRVEVNGEVVTELGVRVNPVDDDVRFDGTRLEAEKSVYVLLNKPKGVVCTNSRHEQKKRVIDLLPQIRGRIFTVGRLDMDSEGLIILTNDGAFAQEMTHPRYGVSKVYAVLVRGRLDERDLEKARGGVWLSEGPTSGMGLKIDKLGKERTFLKVTLREGKNREIRRVFAKLGHPVISLKRVRIGNLNLHGLSDGDWRFLQLDEVGSLRELARSEEGEEQVPAAPRKRGAMPRMPASRKVGSHKAPARKAAGKTASTRKAPSFKSPTRKAPSRKAVGKKAPVKKKTAARKAIGRPTPGRKPRR